MNFKNMTQKDFLKEVRKEIYAIKLYATSDELNKLDFNKLKYNDSQLCIYGMLTGNCFSERACEIFNKIFDLNILNENNFSDLILKKSEIPYRYNYTYLEVYLYHSNSNYHKHIINFLQSKVKKLKTLKLKDDE